MARLWQTPLAATLSPIIHAAYGRLEALVFPMAPTWLTRADSRGRSAEAVLAALGAELVADARSARAAAAPRLASISS
jgi:hypothetical protein